MTRPSPSGLLLRLVVLMTGALALTIALPASLLGPAAVVVILLAAAVPTVIPGRWPALALELCAALLWPASSFGNVSGSAGNPGPHDAETLAPAGVSSVGALILLAALLYLHHTSCALAAATPWDTIVTPPVFTRWLRLAGLAIAPAAVLAVIGALLPGSLHDSAPIVIPVAGILLAVLTIAFIVRTARPSR